jgi:hypothetical protein
VCEHPKLMSVNCVIKCAVCGAEIQQGPPEKTAPKKRGPKKKGENKE